MRQIPARTSSAIVAVLAGCLGVAGVGSGADAQGLMYTRDINVDVTSAWVFRGAQRAEETAQVTGELRLNGIHVGATFLQPFDGDDFASEARLYGGWSPHWEDHGSMIDLELGLTWYTTPNDAPGFPEDDRFEPYARLYFEAPLMPSITSYYDTELETFSLEGRLTHFKGFGLNGIQLGLDGGLVSPDDADDHTYAQGSVDYIRSFLNGMEAYIGLRGAVSSEERYFDDVTAFGPLYDDDAKAWVTAGFSATF